MFCRLKRVYRDLPLDARKKLYCALIQPHTSVVLDQLTVESLEWKKRWRPYKCRAELLF